MLQPCNHRFAFPLCYAAQAGRMSRPKSVFFQRGFFPRRIADDDVEAFARSEKNFRKRDGKMKHAQSGERFLCVAVLTRADNRGFDFFPMRHVHFQWGAT